MTGAARKHAPPDALTRAELDRLEEWYAGKWPSRWKGDDRGRRAWVVAQAEACLDWHASKGRAHWCADYVAACRNWIRKSMERWKLPEPPSSAPSPRGRKPFEERSDVQPIGPLLARMLGR